MSYFNFFYCKCGNYDNYFKLKEQGFLLQINLLSLTGYYGKRIAKAAHFMIAENLVDLVGSDMHHVGHLDMMQNKANLEIIHRHLDGRQYNLLTDL